MNPPAIQIHVVQGSTNCRSKTVTGENERENLVYKHSLLCQSNIQKKKTHKKQNLRNKNGKKEESSIYSLSAAKIIGRNKRKLKLTSKGTKH